jgi:hypothetical protein
MALRQCCSETAVSKWQAMVVTTTLFYIYSQVHSRSQLEPFAGGGQGGAARSRSMMTGRRGVFGCSLPDSLCWSKQFKKCHPLTAVSWC